MGIAENFDLFDAADIVYEVEQTGPLGLGFNLGDTFEAKMAATREALKRQLRAGKHLMVATSFGKDSAVLTMLVLQALEEVIAEHGAAPKVFVITSNTLLENPIMNMYCMREVRKVRQYAKQHGLPLEMRVATPSVSNNYLVNLIGGRIIASLPDAGRKCTVMMKIAPLERLKKQLTKELGYSKKVAREKFVTVIGKRTDESESRGRNVASNGERPDAPAKMLRDKTGKTYEWVMSPIAAWTLDDVFMAIAMVRNNMVSTYSDFKALVDVYRSANSGGECMVNVYAKGKPGRTACGARTGCHICLAVGDDKSMENMLNDPDMAFMRPLNAFRNFIKRNHYRLDKRNWVCRTINKDGSVNLSPNSYSPQFCLDLLRYALTIDAEEREAAQLLGIAPRFELLRLEDIIAIDHLWARYGYQNGLMACYTARQVEEGKRWHIPDEDPSEQYPTALPMLRKMAVPFADRSFGQLASGALDVHAAITDSMDPLAFPKGDEFNVDAEGAAMFWAFELDNAIEMYRPTKEDIAVYGDDAAPAVGVHYFLRMETIELYKAFHNEFERIMQMSNQISRHGIRDILHDPNALVKALGQPGKFIPASGQQFDIEDQIRLQQELEGLNEGLALQPGVELRDSRRVIASG